MNNSVELYWLGQMGLLVRSGNTSICIDYFAAPNDDRQVPPPIPAEELKGIDIFIGTHDHIDHIDHVSWKIWSQNNPDARFVFPRKHMDSVLADGVKPENAVGMNAGESITIGDAVIHAVAASHEFLDVDSDTGLYPYMQYIIEINGVRIHHAGDTVRYEGMLPAVKSYGNIDIQLLPINGRDAKRYSENCIGNMTYQEAADFAGEVGASLVLPGHWDMFAFNGEDPCKFKEYIEVKYGDRIKCMIPKVMEKIVYPVR